VGGNVTKCRTSDFGDMWRPLEVVAALKVDSRFDVTTCVC